MRLTSEERGMLAGAEGPAVKKAMQIVTALAEIYAAECLVPVASVQIAGVSFKNLGDAGLEFLQEWAAQGARVRVPSFLNPAGMDMARWQEMRVAPSFAEKQIELVRTLESMGAEPTCTCTPYLVGHAPQLGQHLAWSESSAVSYANSVVGALTNREGGPSALAAAIVGRTAAYGLHLTENRRPTHVIDVAARLENEADYAALGSFVGRTVGDGIPYFRLRSLSAAPTQEQLMTLGAAMAASGAVALYHVEGVTPEAATLAPAAALPIVAVPDLREAHAGLNSPVDAIDFVSVGCPHSTLRDIERIATLLDGHRVTATLWITTSRYVRALAEQRGLVKRIEQAGGHVLADTCLIVAPVEEMGFTAMATNSGKAAFYAPAHSHLQRRLGSIEQCMAAAITGRWSEEQGQDGV